MVKESLFINYRSQWPISFEQEIDASLSKLWEIISKPGHLEQFHPYCKKHETVKWPGIESQDFLTYLNGKIYKREILEWNVKQSFSLVIGEIDGPKSFVKWQFKDNRKNTKVKITVYPHLLIKWPKFFSYIPVCPKFQGHHLYIVFEFASYKVKTYLTEDSTFFNIIFPFRLNLSSHRMLDVPYNESCQEMTVFFRKQDLFRMYEIRESFLISLVSLLKHAFFQFFMNVFYEIVIAHLNACIYIPITKYTV